MRKKITTLSLTTLLLYGACGLTHAQTEINQARVLEGGDSGLFTDWPGFPLSITRGGHYKLTGSLQVPAGKAGIVISATGVTLDMNGYSVFTSAQCTRIDATGYVGCNTPLLGGIGIEIKAGGSKVTNGRISGFETGVQFKGGDHLRDLLVQNNVVGVRSEGMASAQTLIESVRAQFNQNGGFVVAHALIRGSSAGANGGYGFHVDNGVLLDSSATYNGGEGVAGSANQNLAVGRNVSKHNGRADYWNVRSIGHNLNTANDVF